MNLERAILVGGPKDGAKVSVNESSDLYRVETADRRLAIYERTVERRDSFQLFVFTRWGKLPNK